MLSIQKEKLLSAQNIISSEKMSLKNGSIKNFYTADEGKQNFWESDKDAGKAVGKT